MQVASASQEVTAGLGKRHRDGFVEIHAEQEGCSEEPWRVAAQDRTIWQGTEAPFIARSTQKVQRDELPRGRFVLRG